MPVSRGIAIAVVCAVGASGSLRGQATDALYARFNAVSGWETRGFAFDPGIGTKSVWEWTLPLVVVAPIGRSVSLDLTTNYASARLDSYAGSSETLSGLTDTEVRILYTMSRDRLVGSISFNLPTGQHTLSASQFSVAGAVGSNYLSFPVSNFGTAFGVTGGVAYAQTAGGWNLGLSGSARYLSTYSPFAGDTVSYAPGMEVRVRGGADRLLGNKSRLLLGATVSTFSTDVYTGSNALVAGSYAPGTRLIGDVTWLRVFGRSTVTVAAWDLYRLAGVGSTGPNPETKENVLDADVRLTYGLRPGIEVEPSVAFRQWTPADYVGGRLGSGALTVRAGLTPRLALTVVGRYDAGWIFDQTSGRANLSGYGASAFLRLER
jgi:hypothetical protein